MIYIKPGIFDRTEDTQFDVEISLRRQIFVIEDLVVQKNPESFMNKGFSSRRQIWIPLEIERR